MSTHEIIKKNLAVPKILITLSVLIFFLITLGGWVRNMGAGLACPDWPLCFGKIIPHFDIQIFAEFFHRLIAGLVSLLLLYVVVVTTVNKSWRALLGRLNIMAVLLLLSQVVLGGLTVLHLLKEEIVTLHLSVGTLFFGVILIMTLRANRFGKPPVLFSIAKDKKRQTPPAAWKWGIYATSFIYIQIVLGGVVASHYAGLACPDFPKCLGEWFPPFEGTIAIQIMHRIGALVATIVVLGFCNEVFKLSQKPKWLKILNIAVFAVLLTQISLGIGNVYMRLPVWMSVSHLAVAELLFALVIICTYEIRHHQLH
ncbi:MAG: COX15/CtaA family protein [Oligoflexia bacterium]|nr:COX15/CtaA family protein [Oligoflexia bacterium]